MFQSALPYLQREFIEAAIHPTHAVTLPEVLIVYKQSNRACRFLQQSFSGGFGGRYRACALSKRQLFFSLP
jgi:hypothetical protein